MTCIEYATLGECILIDHLVGTSDKAFPLNLIPPSLGFATLGDTGAAQEYQELQLDLHVHGQGVQHPRVAGEHRTGGENPPTCMPHSNDETHTSQHIARPWRFSGYVRTGAYVCMLCVYVCVSF